MREVRVPTIFWHSRYQTDMGTASRMTQAKEDLWQELQNLRGWYDSLQREKEQLDSQLNLSESILSQRNVQDADKSSDVATLRIEFVKHKERLRAAEEENKQLTKRLENADVEQSRKTRALEEEIRQLTRRQENADTRALEEEIKQLTRRLEVRAVCFFQACARSQLTPQASTERRPAIQEGSSFGRREQAADEKPG
eukprot:3763507-Rhodomonas_salina.1